MLKKSHAQFLKIEIYLNLIKQTKEKKSKFGIFLESFMTV